MMTDEQYLTVQAQLIALSQLVPAMDLTGFVDRINRAEAVGPIVDPTLYRQAKEGLSRIKNIAEAALTFQVALKRAGL